MLNRITTMGRLTRDPELKYTLSEVPVCTITLAVERDIKNAQGEQDVDFVNVVVWRNRAQFLSQYAKKGQLICVDGRLQSRRWVDASGTNRINWEIMADNVYLSGAEIKNTGNYEREKQGIEYKHKKNQDAHNNNLNLLQNSDEFDELEGDDVPF